MTVHYDALENIVMHKKIRRILSDTIGARRSSSWLHFFCLTV